MWALGWQWTSVYSNLTLIMFIQVVTGPQSPVDHRNGLLLMPALMVLHLEHCNWIKQSFKGFIECQSTTNSDLNFLIVQFDLLKNDFRWRCLRKLYQNIQWILNAVYYPNSVPEDPPQSLNTQRKNSAVGQIAINVILEDTISDHLFLPQ